MLEYEYTYMRWKTSNSRFSGGVTRILVHGILPRSLRNLHSNHHHRASPPPYLAECRLSSTILFPLGLFLRKTVRGRKSSELDHCYPGLWNLYCRDKQARSPSPHRCADLFWTHGPAYYPRMQGCPNQGNHVEQSQLRGRLAKDLPACCRHDTRYSSGLRAYSNA